MKRLLVVADHSLVIHSIRLALRQTAGFQVAAAEHRRVARAGCPPGQSRGRSVEEFIAIRGDDERKAAALVDREGYEAHGLKTSMWRGPSIHGASTRAWASMSDCSAGLMPSGSGSAA